MDTLLILNLCFGAGGVLLMLGIAYSYDAKSSPKSRQVSNVLLVLGNLILLGCLTGEYILGHEVITSIVMLVIANYAIWKKTRKEKDNKSE
jgi:hypothetical protein